MYVKHIKRRQLMGAAALLGGLPLCGWPLPARALAGQIRIVTSHLPPLVVENGGLRGGALMEVVEELCKRVRLTPATEFMPWNRALFVSNHAPATAIFPVTRQPDRELKFRWLAQLYEEKYLFLAPKGRSFDVRRPGAMKDRRITLIRGAALAVALREMGYLNIVEAGSVDEVHRFLVEGMADAAFGEQSIVRNALRTRKVEARFDTSAPVRRTAAWLAGSLDFTPADALMFEQAMKQMHADGTCLKIFKRYDMA